MDARTFANPRPSTRPSPDAPTPMTSASSATAPRICPRVAPRVRSRANSRVRSATVIVNVLKMMNAPTSSAAPANASRAGVRKLPIWSLISSAFWSAASVPVRTSSPAGTAARTRRTSVLGRNALLRGDVDGGHLALAVEPALDVGQRCRDDVGAARIRASEVVGPDDCHLLRAVARGDAERVAGLEAVLLGRGADECDLAGAPRHAAVHIGDRLEGLARRRSDDRAAATRGLLQLAVDDQRAGRPEVALGLRHAWHGPDVVDKPLAEWPSGAELAGERLLRSDLDVDTAVGGAGQLGKAAPHLVGQHVGAGDHRDSEQHRDGG